MMDCATILFSGHALRRMFERRLTRDDILSVLHNGEMIAEYRDDEPYPSCLLLGLTPNGPIHAVVARDAKTRRCFVVTAYRPNPEVWSNDFKTRR